MSIFEQKITRQRNKPCKIIKHTNKYKIIWKEKSCINNFRKRNFKHKKMKKNVNVRLTCIFLHIAMVILQYL